MKKAFVCLGQGLFSVSIVLLVIASCFVVLPTSVFAASDAANNIFDITNGSITIHKGSVANTLQVVYDGGQVVDIPFPAPASHPLTIINSSGGAVANPIVVDGTGLGQAQIDITIDHVQVDVSGQTGAYAFTLTQRANVKLHLVGVNRFLSGQYRAGIRVSNTEVCALTIVGTGSLYAASSGEGAGIGGHRGPTGGGNGTVIIESGTVEAYSAAGVGVNGHGAGIGGGYGSSSDGSGTTNTGGAGGTVIIRGGIVTAISSLNGNGYGAGIGGGANNGLHGGNGGTVNIEGGSVLASSTQNGTHGYGAGIGGGAAEIAGGQGGAAAVMTVTGGTIQAFCTMGVSGGMAPHGIGSGSGTTHASGGSNTIKGGSLKTLLAAGNPSGVGDMSPAPTNGTSAVHLSTINVGSSTQPNAAISSGALNNVAFTQNASGGYGIKNVVTDTSSRLYLWFLPAPSMEFMKITTTAGNFSSAFVRNSDNTTEATLYPPSQYLFHPNDGISSPLYMPFYLVGSVATLPPKPIRRNYAFTGWHTDPVIPSPYDFSQRIPSGGPVTVYAHWVNGTVTVSYNSQGGNFVVGSHVLYGNKITAPVSPPIKQGYTFAGWFTSATDAATRWNFNTVLNDSTQTALTLYAHWNPNPVVVVFDSQGGSTVANQTAYYHATVAEPPVPTLAGYTLTGWYTDPVAGSLWNFSSLLNDPTQISLVLYARWAPNPISVVFDSQGGDVVASQTANYNTKVASPVAPSRVGYLFQGWYTASVGGSLWDFTTLLSNPTQTSLVLYAQWNPNPVPVVFDSQGGSEVGGQMAYFDARIEIPITPILTGYTFQGWYTAPVAGNVWDFNMVLDNPAQTSLILYAQWNPNPVPIVFDSQGGSEVGGQVAYFDARIEMPITPILTGYTFQGWYTAPVAGNVWDFNMVLDNPAQTNLILYAHWREEIASYRVMYDSNHSNLGTTQIQDQTGYVAGSVVALRLAAEVPPRAGYTFVGWSTQANGSGTFYKAGSNLTINGDVRLYAQWQRNSDGGVSSGMAPTSSSSSQSSSGNPSNAGSGSSVVGSGGVGSVASSGAGISSSEIGSSTPMNVTSSAMGSFGAFGSVSSGAGLASTSPVPWWLFVLVSLFLIGSMAWFILAKRRKRREEEGEN